MPFRLQRLQRLHRHRHLLASSGLLADHHLEHDLHSVLDPDHHLPSQVVADVWKVHHFDHDLHLVHPYPLSSVPSSFSSIHSTIDSTFASSRVPSTLVPSGCAVSKTLKTNSSCWLKTTRSCLQNVHNECATG